MKKLCIINILLIALFILPVFISSCKDTSTAPNPDTINYPASNISYNQYIQPIFNYHCNSKGCHNSSDMGGGLDLTSYLGAFSKVIPKYPSNSTLVQVIKGLDPNHVPYNTVPLNQKEITAITTWVTEGAKNN
jgi:hypothetical protein